MHKIWLSYDFTKQYQLAVHFSQWWLLKIPLSIVHSLFWAVTESSHFFVTDFRKFCDKDLLIHLCSSGVA